MRKVLDVVKYVEMRKDCEVALEVIVATTLRFVASSWLSAHLGLMYTGAVVPPPPPEFYISSTNNPPLASS